ncbi:MAG: hypothetical protein ACI9BW_002374 [Gammaproteobacteria bacterium]|jgi:hypothetical protein
MTFSELGSLGEFIAAIATLATLVYLALQIRQNTDSVRMSAEMDASHKMADWLELGVTDPSIANLWDKAANEAESLTDEEIRRFLWFVAQLFLIYEGQYNLYKRGHLDESVWTAKVASLFGLLKNPIVANWWGSRIAPYSPEFVEYIENRRKLFDGEWSHQSVAQGGKSDT